MKITLKNNASFDEILAVLMNQDSALDIAKKVHFDNIEDLASEIEMAYADEIDDELLDMQRGMQADLANAGLNVTFI